MTETWEQWRKRTEAKQDREALAAAKEARRARRGQLHIHIDFDIGHAGGCRFEAWASDPRYERCVYHSEVRRAQSPADATRAMLAATVQREQVKAAIAAYEQVEDRDMAEAMSEVFAAIAELAAALGVRDINQLPGCWELQVGEGWWFFLNGHDEPCVCSRGVTVAPYTAYVEWQGWPAGMVDPYGGVLAAGEAANEDTFLAALRARIAIAKAPAERTEGKIQ